MDVQDAPPEPPTSPLEDMAELLDSLRSTGSRGELTDSDELEEYCKQVFELCDTERKGYITRKEISQFCGRRNSVLDTVMTSLDADNDGRITFDEFHTSFKVFSENLASPALAPPSVPLSARVKSPLHKLHHSSYEVIYESDPSTDEKAAEWESLVERVDPDGLLKGTDAHKVWLRLTDGDPALLQHFEGFLTDMVEELRQSQTARTKMESQVKRVVDQHTQEVSELEELWEQQLSTVKEDSRMKGWTQAQRLSSRFQGLLASREAVIDHLAAQETSLRKALQDKAQAEQQLRQEREKLASANQVLKEKLNTSIQELGLSRRAVARLSMHEDSPLLKGAEGQGDGQGETVEELQVVEDVSGTSPPVYFPPKKTPSSLVAVRELDGTWSDSTESGGVLGSGSHSHITRRLFPNEGLEGAATNSETLGGRTATGRGLQERVALSEGLDGRAAASEVPPSMEGRTVEGSVEVGMSSEEGSSLLSDYQSEQPTEKSTEQSHENHVTANHTHSATSQTTSAGQQDNSLSLSSWIPRRDDLPRPSSPTAVNRVFKVIFLGNSGVGKTSLILRLSEGHFGSCGTTLGLDFTTKTLRIGEERVVFQLWDTAGQERFHSALTPVYFRRADAFVVVYDVSSKDSFHNCKSWVSIITAALRERPPVLMLVGNKSDRSSERAVPSEDGRRMALELHALFSEMSALSGDNVLQAHTTLARLLLARQNEELEEAKRAAMRLEGEEQRRKCAC